MDDTDRSYTISEVSDMLDVKPYVIYFWEKEFPQIRPPRGKNGRRRYKQKHIAAISKIKQLLWNEKYTIKGVKQLINDENRGTHKPRTSDEIKSLVEQIETGLVEALDLLDSESL